MKPLFKEVARQRPLKSSDGMTLERMGSVRSPALVNVSLEDHEQRISWNRIATTIQVPIRWEIEGALVYEIEGALVYELERGKQ